jgi:molybdate transport system ATP-binding protein
LVFVAGEVNAAGLTARVRKERRDVGGSRFLLDLSIAVSPGITIVFGPSGAGKSTLLDCIAGLLRPESGRIAAGNHVLLDTDCGVDLPPQQRRIAYVFQTLALFPHMSVEDNVSYGLADLQPSLQTARVTEILRSFRVEELRKRRPAEISGGERQRVALARSLVTTPRALLLDEPMTGLDTELKSSILQDLRTWNAAQKIAILYVTHSREEVDALGEHVIAIDNGRVVGEGTPREVLDAPRRRKLAQAAGFENLLGGTVVSLREEDGVMPVRLEDSSIELEVPLSYVSPGDSVRIAIRAGDILLATQPPEGLSARNVLEGAITSLERRGTLVVVRVHCGVTFTVHVTPGAERALQLAAGKRVWLVLKTHSCHLVSD